MAAGKDGKRLAIGIDLGTMNSCVAAWKHGKIEILVNNQGNRTTPSYVSFSGDEQLVGDAAFQRCRFNPANTIFGVKRLMGRSYSDPLVQKQINLWPFKVVPSEDGRPSVVAKHRGEEKKFFPEEISTMILAYMKATAEEKLGTIVEDAVITVPANFSDAQRRATKKAGEDAGLNVLRILNEPTAAAIAYDLDEASWGDGPRNVLVFDLGGGTMDVSIFRLEGKALQLSVKSTAGDTHLGGEDFDERMMWFLMTKLKKKHGLDINDKPKYLRLMRTECERAKKVLSFSEQTMIGLEFAQEEIEFEYMFTRAKFEDLNMDLFGRCRKIVEGCLVDAKMHRGDIDDVVLAGGSSRIPKVQQMLEDLFGGEKLRRTINPDEAIACGAAVYAAKQVGIGNEKVRNLTLADVTPLSLGIELFGRRMHVIIPRNTNVPVKKETVRSNPYDNDTSLAISIYEGERPICTKNHLLAEFTFGPLPPSRAGETKVVVGMEVDADGILSVWAEHKESGLRMDIKIGNLHGTLSMEEIESSIKKADERRLEDNQQLERSWSMAGLETLIENGMSRIRDTQIKMTSECRKTLEDEVRKADEWLQRNQDAEASEILKKWEHLEKKLNKYIDLKGLTIKEHFSCRGFSRSFCFRGEYESYSLCLYILENNVNEGYILHNIM